jgi:hypothetical protein
VSEITHISWTSDPNFNICDFARAIIFYQLKCHTFLRTTHPLILIHHQLTTKTISNDLQIMGQWPQEPSNIISYVILLPSTWRPSSNNHIHKPPECCECVALSAGTETTIKQSINHLQPTTITNQPPKCCELAYGLCWYRNSNQWIAKASNNHIHQPHECCELVWPICWYRNRILWITIGQACWGGERLSTSKPVLNSIYIQQSIRGSSSTQCTSRQDNMTVSNNQPSIELKYVSLTLLCLCVDY